jgi:hypothetical protein
MDFQINDRWAIKTDDLCFHLMRRVKRKVGNEEKWDAIGYYPTLNGLLGGLLKYKVLESDCKSLQDLTKAVQEVQRVIEEIGPCFHVRRRKK